MERRYCFGSKYIPLVVLKKRAEMSLSLSQVLKQTQKLAMTPQMQQSIQLLQLTTIELEQLAEQELIENPFLEIPEEGEEPREREEVETGRESKEEGIRKSNESTGTDDAKSASPNRLADLDVNWGEVYDGSENEVYFPRTAEEEEHDFTEYTAKRSSLYDHLRWQLNVSDLDKKDKEIGEFLIGNIDHDGYLRVSAEEAAVTLDVNVREVESVLGVVQTFEPVGVGARDLKECLLLQVKDRGISDSLVTKIISDHLDLLLHKSFKELGKRLGVREKRLKAALGVIVHLEPHPGRSITKDQAPYVVPDVFVKKVNEKYLYYMNDDVSARLRISPFYRRLLQQDNFTKEEKRFAVEKFKSAVWLIKNIEKRKSTIVKVTETIMNFQREFLEKGIEHLRPLTLREVAEETGLHESTIARVTSGKYVETPRGTFALKFFFSSGLDTTHGGIASSRSIKALIGQIVEGEDPKKPLSDQEIAKNLAEKGIKVARRTVAKYREQTNILPAKLRKQTL